MLRRAQTGTFYWLVLGRRSYLKADSSEPRCGMELPFVAALAGSDPTWDSPGTTPMPKRAQDTTTHTFERVGQVEYAWVPGGITILAVTG